MKGDHDKCTKLVSCECECHPTEQPTRPLDYYDLKEWALRADAYMDHLEQQLAEIRARQEAEEHPFMGIHPGSVQTFNRAITDREGDNLHRYGSIEQPTRPDEPAKFDGSMAHLKWSWAMKNYATHLEQRNRKLEAFCQEFVWGEENPGEYKTQADRITELEELNSILIMDRDAVEEGNDGPTTIGLYSRITELERRLNRCSEDLGRMTDKCAELEQR